MSVCGLRKRFNEHKSAVKSGSNLPIHNAIRKYGNKIITEVVIQACPEYCYWFENKLRPEPLIGYNISVGGVCTNLGSKHSEQTKKKISEAVLSHNKDNPCSEELRKIRSKNSLGRLHTEDTKLRISQSQKLLSRDLKSVWVKAAKANSELNPWENPAADTSTWLIANTIYDYVQLNTSHGMRIIEKHFKVNTGKFQAIYKKIKAGWNPLLDTDWLIFSSKLTPDCSGISHKSAIRQT